MEVMRIEDAFEARGCLVVTGRLSDPSIKNIQDLRSLLFGGGLVVVAADGSKVVAEFRDVAISRRSDAELQASIALACAGNWSGDLTENAARAFVGGLLLNNDVQDI